MQLLLDLLARYTFFIISKYYKNRESTQKLRTSKNILRLCDA